jgi:hypothetical protein
MHADFYPIFVVAFWADTVMSDWYHVSEDIIASIFRLNMEKVCYT